MGINMHMKTEADQEKTWLVIRAAVVLHNLFVTSAFDHMSEAQLQRYVEIHEEEPEDPDQDQLVAATLEEVARDTPPQRLRRERLVDEMASPDMYLDERQRMAIIRGTWMPENAP